LTGASGRESRRRSKPARGAREAGQRGICGGGPSDELPCERTCGRSAGPRNENGTALAQNRSLAEETVTRRIIPTIDDDDRRSALGSKRIRVSESRDSDQESPSTTVLLDLTTAEAERTSAPASKRLKRTHQLRARTSDEIRRPLVQPSATLSAFSVPNRACATNDTANVEEADDPSDSSSEEAYMSDDARSTDGLRDSDHSDDGEEERVASATVPDWRQVQSMQASPGDINISSEENRNLYAALDSNGSDGIDSDEDYDPDDVTSHSSSSESDASDESELDDDEMTEFAEPIDVISNKADLLATARKKDTIKGWQLHGWDPGEFKVQLGRFYVL
jgi:hypothetical protein